MKIIYKVLMFILLSGFLSIGSTCLAQETVRFDQMIAFVDYHKKAVYQRLVFTADLSTSTGNATDEAGNIVGSFRLISLPSMQSNFDHIMVLSETALLEDGYQKLHIFFITHNENLIDTNIIYIATALRWPTGEGISIDAQTQPEWEILAKFVDDPNLITLAEFNTMVTQFFRRAEIALNSTFSRLVVDIILSAAESGRLPRHLIPSLSASFLIYDRVPEHREDAVMRINAVWNIFNTEERLQLFQFFYGVNHAFKASSLSNQTLLNLLSLEGYTKNANLAYTVLQDITIPYEDRLNFLEGYLTAFENAGQSVDSWFIGVTKSLGIFGQFESRVNSMIDANPSQYLESVPQMISTDDINTIAQGFLQQPPSQSCFECRVYMITLQNPALNSALRDQIFDRVIAYMQRSSTINDLLGIGIYSLWSYPDVGNILSLVQPQKATAFAQQYIRILNTYVLNSPSTSTFYEALATLIRMIKKANMKDFFLPSLDLLMWKLNPIGANENAAQHDQRIDRVKFFWQQYGIFYMDTSAAQVPDKILTMDHIENIYTALFADYSGIIDVLGVLGSSGLSMGFGMRGGKIGDYGARFWAPSLMPHELAHTIDGEFAPDIAGASGKPFFYSMGSNREPTSFPEYLFSNPSGLYYHSDLNQYEDFAVTMHCWFENSRNLLQGAIDLALQNKPYLLSKVLYIARFFFTQDGQYVKFFTYDVNQDQRYTQQLISVVLDERGGIQGIFLGNKEYSFKYDLNQIVTVTEVPDVIPPTGTISINSGAAYTRASAVTLNLSATDARSGMAQMQFSNNGIVWSAPEAYATTKSWTLSSGDGTKTVYVKFKDVAGNWSPAFSDTVLLDTTKPTATSTLGATTATTVTLNGSTTDPAPSSNIDKIVYNIRQAGINTDLNSMLYYALAPVTKTAGSDLTTFSTSTDVAKSWFGASGIVYTVTGYDKAGNFLTSSKYWYDKANGTLKDPDIAAPNVPAGLTVSNGATPGTANLAWDPSPDGNPPPADVNNEYVNYEIYRNGVLIKSTARVLRTAGQKVTYTDTNLVSGTQYSYQVLARDMWSNKSAKCTAVNFTLDPLAPTVPTGLTASQYGYAYPDGYRAQLSWSASTVSSGTVSYEIYRNDVKVATTTTNSYMDTKLAETTYYYKVRAVANTNHYSGFSNTASVTLVN